MPGIPILCYHKVGPIKEVGRFLNIEPARFKQQIDFFKRRGFHFILSRDLPKCDFQGKQVCLTFDDAYESALTYGREVMLASGVRATFFAVSERLGKTSDWDAEIAQPLADIGSLIEAQSQGFEVGNHTASHPRLNQLDSLHQAEEILQAAKALRSLGLQVNSFAYPYGLHNASACNLVADSHQVGLALGKRLATNTDPLDALPRFVVSYSDSVPMLIYKVWVRNTLRSKR
ncbi:MAG TPA: polysaccharide deacetylase family protein [Fimbriimonadaceae bacterium]|nr:polysaccharide deacetylase family protein [Fimbriimonadaceae bacterium]